MKKCERKERVCKVLLFKLIDNGWSFLLKKSTEKSDSRNNNKTRVSQIHIKYK